MPLILLSLFLTGCASTQVSSDVFSPRSRLQEDSVEWEYQNKERYSTSTYNSNNNILDSQDGSVQTGNGINFMRLRY
jgi:hypothetical protein